MPQVASLPVLRYTYLGPSMLSPARDDDYLVPLLFFFVSALEVSRTLSALVREPIRAHLLPASANGKSLSGF